ncbi:MAG: prolipoprotein diacylglyceryl transferase [Candidatus Peribacteraceae bacterium]|nr:prolipoprotein diacylglyceryl transferase [Candidatus Peribacteraceae bacterium]
MFALFPSRTVALTLFGWDVRWYGILYVAAFLLAFVLLPRLQKWRGLTLSSDEWSGVLSAGIIGVLLGGRLGYVLLYDPIFFWQHPLEVFAVWHGGMSSHGGFLGVAIALLLVARRKGIPLLHLVDLCIVPAAIGLALGRLGNFINQELYGTVTTLPWGMEFPGAQGLRHPVQLYAIAKDLLLALVCFLHLRRSVQRPGSTTALFLMLYSILRFLLEELREQDIPLVSVSGFLFTRAQFFTVPLFLAGVLLWWWSRRRV